MIKKIACELITRAPRSTSTRYIKIEYSTDSEQIYVWLHKSKDVKFIRVDTDTDIANVIALMEAHCD